MMFAIIGLGNPGKEYELTRHNVGWIVLSALAEKHGMPHLTESSRYNGLLSEGTMHDVEAGILLPATYMNNSGRAVATYVKERSELQKLIVVHDEVDLPFGTVRVSYDRGAGGHNGVKSLIDALSSQAFTRIRIGIAQKTFWGTVKRPTGDALSEFVLKPFTGGEQKALTETTERVDSILSSIFKKGVREAMQEFNQ